MTKRWHQIEQLAGAVQMTRYSSNDDADPEGMTIRVEDESSGVIIAEVTMTLEEFARALTASRGKGRVKLNRYAHQLVGTTTETKVVQVFVPQDLHSAANRIDGSELRGLAGVQAIAISVERDGWAMNERDLFNHHRWVSLRDMPTEKLNELRHAAGFNLGTVGQAVNVTLSRYVRADGTPVLSNGGGE